MGCVVSSWTFFWLDYGEVIRSQHHQPSDSNRSGVYMLVGSILVTSPTWWESQYLQDSSKDVAQNIGYSPWGGTEGPWLCLMAKVLEFFLAWWFSFLSPFSHSLIKFALWNLGKAKEVKAFLETRDRWHRSSTPSKAPQCPAQFHHFPNDYWNPSLQRSLFSDNSHGHKYL